MKKAILNIISCLFILAITSPIYGDVTGSWTISGDLTVTAKVKGYRSQKTADIADDTIEFNADHTFLMDDACLGGSWSQTGNRWIIADVDFSEIEGFLEDYFWQHYDYDIDVTVTYLRAFGSEREGKIKGLLKIKANFIALDYNLPGYAIAKYKFTGVRSQGPQDLAFKNFKDLKTVIKESLDRILPHPRVEYLY